MTRCPFCKPNWHKLDIVTKPADDDYAIIRPLNPVTDGHVLVIPSQHTESAAQDFTSSATLMYAAAAYVSYNGLQANIITSIGPDATQTVMHTHLHVVPRRPGDGLHLPWTDQVKPDWRVGGP